MHMLHACTPSLRRLRQEDCEFEAILVYRQILPPQRSQENKTKQQNFPIKSKEVLKDQVSLPMNFLAVRQRVKHAVCYLVTCVPYR